MFEDGHSVPVLTGATGYRLSGVGLTSFDLLEIRLNGSTVFSVRKTGAALENLSQPSPGTVAGQIGYCVHGTCAPVPLELYRSGVETSISTLGTGGVALGVARVWVDGNSSTISEGESGVTAGPALGVPTYDYELPPPTAGVAVCGSTLYVKQNGDEKLSQPLEVAAGSKQCP